MIGCLMILLDKLGHLFHIASSRKLVTYIGLVISSLSAVCLQMGDEWLATHLEGWLTHVCGASIFLGGLIAAFGKGLADRRTDPEKQAIADVNTMEERREPKDE